MTKTKLKCPENMTDTKAWDRYHKKEWDEILNNKNSPKWLKELAKSIIKTYEEV